ncbi:amidohydrolase family protein [Ramlibacter sp. AW1]|uniref:Amidohydrolase family protein n=1 Tax=Ramlibacter aurantiacus TaxID=2801330 RepID=A0A936ZUA8_9BURK|nr:amidohydrolase family protein [Ramlibacter aurantiacus]MBL0422696.1 amidohydrolase family protein [Ramlibacter aurantiacus]
MRIIDSHFHWWPRSVFEDICRRGSYPRAEPNGNGGYMYWRRDGATARFNLGAEWFDLGTQLAHMATLGHDVNVICSIGPFSVHFSDLPVEEGRRAAMQWNEEMAGAQRRHAGRLWASAALPLRDTQVALEVLEHAVGLGLVGVNLPGSIGSDENIDAPRLAPLYERLEALRLPIFLHPTDAMFPDILDGYNGALYASLGRVVDVSVAACRLVLSGIMERHPHLKIVMSHTGGALPYQSGRMDKNSGRAGLPKPPSTYLKRMFTDTVSPHGMGVRFALEYYGADQVMYGSDYPCWSPSAALAVLEEAGLSVEDRQKVMFDNAWRFFELGRY